MQDLIDGVAFQREASTGCPLCGRDNDSRTLPVSYGMTASVAYCRSCSLAYQSPRPSEDASRAYMNWRWNSSDAYVSDNSSKNAQAAEQLSLALQVHPSAQIILDFGAGSGVFVRECLNRGIDAVGVERSERAISKAAEQGIGILRAIPDRAFDLITLWDVIEHLRDPVEALSVLKSHLLPGGVIVAETANYANWRRRLSRDSWGYYLFDHQFYFTPRSLKETARRAGLRLKQTIHRRDLMLGVLSR